MLIYNKACKFCEVVEAAKIYIAYYKVGDFCRVPVKNEETQKVYDLHFCLLARQWVYIKKVARKLP